jgi:glycosyltransferase involved in cell wall biosynthesis/SAM-dependent methyltransferase
MVGNVWSSGQFQQIRDFARETGWKIDWFGNSKLAHLPQDDAAIEADGLFCRGFIPEDRLAVELARYPFVLLPSGRLDGTEDNEWLTRLSIPSRMVFIFAQTYTPTLVLGSPDTAAARLVERLGVGLCAPDNRAAITHARQLATPNERAKFIVNARRVAPAFVMPDAGEWLWRSLAEGHALKTPFDGIWPRAVPGDSHNSQLHSRGMKLLFISHYPSLFGANRSLLNLIDGLRLKQGVSLQVIVAGEGEFSAELKKRNIPYWIVPFEYNTHDASASELPGNRKTEALGPMLEIVRRAKPDIIYSNSSLIYYGAWLSSITHTPHVWHLREYGDLDYGLVHDLGADYFRERLNECAFAIAISQSIERHHLAGLNEKRKRVIYNGVARMDQCATAARELVRGATPRLGLLGLVHPAKGHQHAIEAIRILRDTYPNIVLQIGGSGDPRYLNPLVAQIRRHGLEKNVRFAGYIAAPLAWLNKEIDILLMCSENEAFGRVTAEAMTQGIPVVGNATGGTPEIITDGHNGLLYAGRPDELAAKITRLAGTSDDYRRLSENALADSKRRFTTERYVTEIYEVLEQVLAQTGADSGASCPQPPCPPPVNPPSAPDPFLNPPMEPTNCDLYWVRSSIGRALKQALPFFHGVFLDIGCGVMPYRQQITQAPSRVTHYVGLDIETNIYKADVDLRWDGRHIPLEDASVDCAMATEVLEHCPEPLVVLKEARRVLKPGGVFFFTVPFVWPLHDAPYDFFRYTPFALEKLLAEAGLADARVRALGGWNASLAQMIGLWLKRSPMPEEIRQKMAAQLWPFYQELVKTDEIPADSRAANTMATGWSGLAFAPRAEAPSEIGKCDLPMVLVRCDEFKYSETFLEDHVNYLSRGLTTLHGLPFPRFLRGGRSIQTQAFEAELQSANAAGGQFPPAIWRSYTDGLASYLKASGARVALVETGLMGAFVYQACEQAGLPYVVHFHGVDATGRDILDQWGRHYERFFRSAAALIVVSKAMRTQLLRLGAPAERVMLAPYGVSVELPNLADPAQSPPRFLAVGRFVEKKAPQYTLQAFALVHEGLPAARLIMVGDGPLLAACRQWVRARGLDEAVTFVGVQPREAVSQLMAGSRVFVQHSLVASDGDSEGLPLAILEAGAHGLPVVATCHAGIPDAVTDGLHGYLGPEGDVKAMAERMRLLATDAAQAGRMGTAFRERVRAEFSRKVSITRLQTILTGVADGKSPAR